MEWPFALELLRRGRGGVGDDAEMSMIVEEGPKGANEISDQVASRMITMAQKKKFGRKKNVMVRSYLIALHPSH